MPMQSLEQVKEATAAIGKALGEHIDKDNPDEVIGKIQELSALLALSSHAVALSEMIYNEKLAELAQSTAYAGLSATDKKMIFGGRAKTEIYYLTLAERQNKAITHRIDGLRSIISYLKEEAKGGIHVP